MFLKVLSSKQLIVLVIAAASCLAFASNTQAALIQLPSLEPGSTKFPGLVPSGTAPGTLVAGPLTSPFEFSTAAGLTRGTLTSSAYKEALTGTLDFYYQLQNIASSATSIGSEMVSNYLGFQTYVGYRIDGSTLTGFVDGTVPPILVNSNANGSTIKFLFNLTSAETIHPGQSSTVFVISTNATNFSQGSATISDGGAQAVSAFQPAAGTSVSGAAAAPEPGTLLLMGGGILVLGGLRKIRNRRCQ